MGPMCGGEGGSVRNMVSVGVMGGRRQCENFGTVRFLDRLLFYALSFLALVRLQ